MVRLSLVVLLLAPICRADDGATPVEDDSEMVQLRSNPAVRRSSGTLRIHTASRTVEFQDNDCECESAIRHRLADVYDVGKVRKDYLVDAQHWEGGEYFIVNGANGCKAQVGAEVVLSPDKRYYASAALDIDAGYSENKLYLIQARDCITLFEYEWSGETNSGPSGIVWKSNREFHFDELTQTYSARGPSPEPSKVRMKIYKRSGKWFGPERLP